MQKLFFRSLAASLLATTGVVYAQAYHPLKEPECLTSVASLFTTGGQYVDQNNGVRDNSYSMLMRWQGDNINDNPVTYDMSRYTGFGFASTVSPTYGTPPPVGSLSQWQRGALDDGVNGTPGAQLYCNGGGMLLNSWWVPHVNINGGGYNDMFGYQWGAGQEPPAFGRAGFIGTSTLTLQAFLGVRWFYGHRGLGARQQDPHGQLALFAYIIDANRPSLAPIAIVVNAYDSFADNLASPTADGSVGQDYVGGVYFVSATFNKSTPYTTINQYSSTSVLIPSSYPNTSDTIWDNTNGTAPFFRILITPTNWNSAIQEINKKICGLKNCGTAGYTHPATAGYTSYKLKYAGVIAETRVFDGDFSGSINDGHFDQVSMGANFHDFGIFSFW